jgi:hypothetical protein
MRPPASPATMVQPFRTAQHCAEASQKNVAIPVPLSSSHTLSVRSYEAETARRPSGVTAKASTRPAWPSPECSEPREIGVQRRARSA